MKRKNMRIKRMKIIIKKEKMEKRMEKIKMDQQHHPHHPHPHPHPPHHIPFHDFDDHFNEKLKDDNDHNSSGSSDFEDVISDQALGEWILVDDAAFTEGGQPRRTAVVDIIVIQARNITLTGLYCVIKCHGKICRTRRIRADPKRCVCIWDELVQFEISPWREEDTENNIAHIMLYENHLLGPHLLGTVKIPLRCIGSAETPLGHDVWFPLESRHARVPSNIDIQLNLVTRIHSAEDDMPSDPVEKKKEELCHLKEIELECELCHTLHTGEYVFVIDCDHRFCVSCVTPYIHKVLSDPSLLEVCCPMEGCDMILGQWILKQVMTEDQYDSFLKRSLLSLLQSKQSKSTSSSSESCFFQCVNPDCHMIMESIDISQSKEWKSFPVAKQCKLQNRFRCRACSTEFCKQCKVSPFHEQHTCESFEEYQKARKCRYCLNPIRDDPQESDDILDLMVCKDAECAQKKRFACPKRLDCTHLCCGVAGEPECLRCLHQDCVKNQKEELKIDLMDGEDYCNICWIEGLNAAPCIELTCHHVFHYACLAKRIQARWDGNVISFGFLECPLCKRDIQHDALAGLLKKANSCRDQVRAKALQRLSYEQLTQCKDITDPQSHFYKKPQEYAMHRYAYYECEKCKQPYFAGMKSCDGIQGQPDDDDDEPRNICQACSPESRSLVATCEKHGNKFIEYKCNFCCSVASWFCWGRTHFCDTCHSKQRAGNYLSRKPISFFPVCKGPQSCPLGISHPKHGTKEKVPLGCAACRNVDHF